MNSSINVFVIEKQNLLREKIAGILSREDNINMVTQMSSYPRLQKALKKTVPDLVLGDFFEFNKFCTDTGISSKELCADEKLLLYSDESVYLIRIVDGHIGNQSVFDVRFILEEVTKFHKNMKPLIKIAAIKKHTKKKEVKKSG